MHLQCMHESNRAQKQCTYIYVSNPPESTNHRWLRDGVSCVEDETKQKNTGDRLCRCRCSKGGSNGAEPSFHSDCHREDEQEEYTANGMISHAELHRHNGRRTHKNWPAERWRPVRKYSITPKTTSVIKVMGMSTAVRAIASIDGSEARSFNFAGSKNVE